MSQPAHDPRRMITDAIRRWQRSTVASRKWGKSVRWRKSSVDFQRRERFRETAGREPSAAPALQGRSGSHVGPEKPLRWPTSGQQAPARGVRRPSHAWSRHRGGQAVRGL